MKLKLLLTFFFSYLAILTYSQTKLIAHRSHSGSNLTFSLDSPDNLGKVLSKEDRKQLMKSYEEEEKKRLEEEIKRQHEQKVIEEAIKKEAEKKAALEKQKQVEEEKQKLLEAEKNKTVAKDSAVKRNSAKVIKDTTGKNHKRQFYSPYGLPTNKTPKPQAGSFHLKNEFSVENTTMKADFSFVTWLLLSSIAISYFFIKKQP